MKCSEVNETYSAIFYEDFLLENDTLTIIPENNYYTGEITFKSGNTWQYEFYIEDLVTSGTYGRCPRIVLYNNFNKETQEKPEPTMGVAVILSGEWYYLDGWHKGGHVYLYINVDIPKTSDIWLEIKYAEVGDFSTYENTYPDAYVIIKVQDLDTNTTEILLNKYIGDGDPGPGWFIDRFNISKYSGHSIRIILSGNAGGHVKYCSGCTGTWDGEEIGYDYVKIITNDTDGDGLADVLEDECGTDPNDPDTDNDGLPDGWEYYHDLDPLNSSDASLDFDGDGLTNLEEYELGTDPWNVDSDSDGMPDGWEVRYNLDPTNSSDANLDADNDGLSNIDEYEHNTNPLNSDSDGDGLPDGWEVQYGLDPLNPSDAELDFDGDGLSNVEEYRYGTDPTATDSDHDGFSDGLEVSLGTNPALFIDNPLTTRIIPLVIVLVIIVKIVLILRWRSLMGLVRKWAGKRYEL